MLSLNILENEIQAGANLRSHEMASDDIPTQVRVHPRTHPARARGLKPRLVHRRLLYLGPLQLTAMEKPPRQGVSDDPATAGAGWRAEPQLPEPRWAPPQGRGLAASLTAPGSPAVVEGAPAQA